MKCKLWGTRGPRWYACDRYGLLITLGGVSVVTSVKLTKIYEIQCVLLIKSTHCNKIHVYEVKII